MQKGFDILIEKATPIHIGFKEDVGENGGVIYTCPRGENENQS